MPQNNMNSSLPHLLTILVFKVMSILQTNCDQNKCKLLLLDHCILAYQNVIGARSNTVVGRNYPLSSITFLQICQSKDILVNK